ncbi:hypothetical protein C6P45_000070 [Maudiozyma exigua]|uniref:UBX domain-containing protein n=1 Tax=Maudiozyma exigua TaxID=34358 RepID=A0A9P6WFJ7_MAUEX|nr:hypothetical protein C6P45_000070 [Kazachstania exigua]
MSSVNIVHNFRTFNVKVSPNDQLNNAMEQSITHFKLARRDGSRFILFHNKTPVALDLPWRFLNLPAGAKLELLELGQVESSDPDTNLNPLKVRFIVNLHYGTIMQEIQTSDSMYGTIEKIAMLQKWDTQLNNETSNIMIQVFNKRYNVLDLKEQTFQSLGINEPLSIRVTLPDLTPKNTTEPKTVETIEETPKLMQSTDTVVTREAPQVIQHLPQHEPVAYIPSKTPIADQVMEISKEDDFEMTVEQARRYQEILRKKTGNLGGPLMTKRMRDEMEQKNRHNITITDCLVRIKFPDLTYLEIRFSPTDSSQTIYEEVTKSLVKPNEAFKLFYPHPQKYIERSAEQELVKDLAFSSKTILLYESESLADKGPFLKSTLLKDATILSMKEEITTAPTRTVDEPTTSTKKKSLNKVPKWLKLSKK